MNKSCDKFNNPDNLPVENVTISVNKAGVLQKVKALDPYFVESRVFTLYERPPQSSSQVLGELDTWKNRMHGCIEDLKWLLAMDHHKFWSCVLYHNRCMDLLVSFLQESNPPYIEPYENTTVRDIYCEIRKLVLIVYSRLITNRESKCNWMTKEFLSDIIYDSFIFTIPVLWDICLVYGSDNTKHVSQIVNSVFILQPKYMTDLAAAIAFVKEAFKYIILTVNPNYDCNDPPNLPKTFQGFSKIERPKHTKEESLTFSMLKDIIIHLLDTVLTIRIFIEACPQTVSVFKKAGFVLSIVQLYEHAIPHLYEKLEEFVGENDCELLQSHLEAARSEIIDIYREVLANAKNSIFNAEDNVEAHVEDYLNIMMDGLTEKLLMKDYQASYPVQDDIDMLKQAYPNIDTVKTDFILQAVFSNIDQPLPEAIGDVPLTNGHSVPESDSIDNTEIRPSTSIDNEIPTNIREESLISEVKDILPHLGDGFILKCLNHYGFNAERVINSVLEDSLVEPLKSMDRSLPLIPEDPLDKNFLDTGVQRLNVFDGDKFDIMTRDDVDVSKIHIGKKKSKYKDLKEMLNDKSEVKQLAEVYSKYNLVSEYADASMYSDEYDDTYDEVGGASAQREALDDERRPFVTPRVLEVRDSREAREESSEEESQPEETPARSKLDFCSNPEELRAKREANWRLRNNSHRPQGPPKNADVVGKARGQGQEKEVLVNRDKKEKNKGNRANHNRRQGAQWKRSQGMMPS